jgi:hypothetical protein
MAALLWKRSSSAVCCGVPSRRACIVRRKGRRSAGCGGASALPAELCVVAGRLRVRLASWFQESTCEIQSTEGERLNLRGLRRASRSRIDRWGPPADEPLLSSVSELRCQGSQSDELRQGSLDGLVIGVVWEPPTPFVTKQFGIHLCSQQSVRGRPSWCW